LTPREVQDVLGSPVTRTPGAHGPGFSNCSYSASSGQIVLEERSHQDLIRATTAFDNLRDSQQHADTIPDIGDEAFKGDTGYAARDDTLVLTMTVSLTNSPVGPGSTPPEPPTEDALQGLLATAVARMGPRA